MYFVLLDNIANIPSVCLGKNFPLTCYVFVTVFALKYVSINVTTIYDRVNR